MSIDPIETECLSLVTLSEALAEARRFINDHCIYRVPFGEPMIPGKLPGTVYMWQFYLRRLLFNGRHLKTIAKLFWQRMLPVYRAQRFQITGLEAASSPLIVAIVMEAESMGLDVRAFSIRKEPKSYGLLNRIEGYPSTDPVLIVDDLTSQTHGSLWTCIKVIHDHGLNMINRVFVVVNKNYTLTTDYDVLAIGAEKIYIESLFTLDDFDMTFGDYQRNQGRDPVFEVCKPWHGSPTSLSASTE